MYKFQVRIQKIYIFYFQPGKKKTTFSVCNVEFFTEQGNASQHHEKVISDFLYGSKTKHLYSK